MNNTFFLWLKGMTMSGNNLQYNNRGHYNVSSTGSSRYGWNDGWNDGWMLRQMMG